MNAKNAVTLLAERSIRLLSDHGDPHRNSQSTEPPELDDHVLEGLPQSTSIHQIMKLCCYEIPGEIMCL